MTKLARRCFLIALSTFFCFVITGCSRYENALSEKREDGKLKVVTTLFPYYDFVRQIAGDKVDLTMVLPAGMDSHSFEPTPADIITIQNGDLLICNGGAMEIWLSRVVDSLDTSDLTVVTMMDYVDTVEEEVVEGMEDEDGHDHSHGDEDHEHGDASDDDGHAVEIEYDEHIWTSPVNAMALSRVIGEALGEADPANKDYYEERTEAYVDQLKELDQEFRTVIENSDRSMIIFGDKFPLRYLADEYGLSYRAAFTGCSSDTEPSARTIAYLIDKVEEEKIPAVYYLELSSHRVSEIIGEETGAIPLLFHSCHNVTRQEFDGGVTYLDLMGKNVINLRKGLEE